MEAYKSLSKYTVTKRTVYSVKNNKPRNRSGNHDGLIGSVVLIDDKKYKVLGVEAFALAAIDEDQIMGLMVKEENEGW